VLSAAAFAALFGGAACGSGGPSADMPGSPAASTQPSTPETSATAAAPSTTRVARTTTSRSPAVREQPTTTSRVPATRLTTTTYVVNPGCRTNPDGTQSCTVSGRPLWRRRRWRRRELLLPAGSGDGDARTEYASVASFAELSLRLIAVGAPVELVAACHAAALDEIRHAEACEAIATGSDVRFGAIPALLGRRIGGRRRTRAAEVARIAADSYVDGWRNESLAAAELRDRAAAAGSLEDRATLEAMAADEDRHAALAKDIVTWCFEMEPAAVTRALEPFAA
jgi:hypothetical protein